MNDNMAIQLFEGNKIRIVWDAEAEKYWFSIVDVVQVLTESADGRKYWNKLKQHKSCHLKAKKINNTVGLGRK